MKLDLNNIDDIFKEGLDDFTGQPSQGLWKKISGKLLWNDLIHFRFVNIPKPWLGFSAGVVLLSTLLLLWFLRVPMSSETQQIIHSAPATEALNHDQGSAYSENDNNEISLPSAGQIVEGPKTSLETIIDNENKDEIQKIQSPQNDKFIVQEILFDLNDTLISGEPSPESRKAMPAVIVADDVTPAPKTENVSHTVAPASSVSEVSIKQMPANKPDTAPINENMLENSQTVTGILADAVTVFSGNSSADAIVYNPGKLKTISPISFSTGSIFNSKSKPQQRAFHQQLAIGYRAYKPYLSLAAYFAPEITWYYRPASASREQSYAGGLSLSYIGSNYLVQAGIEYSKARDLGDYMVNINSYDSIGYYNGISGFEIVPGYNGEDSLAYNFHTVEVWDTLPHHSHQQTQNKYTYIQIPVMVGYKAMESGRFSAFIKAGPNFSFLLNGTEQSLNFQPSQTARVTGIDNFTAPRLQASMQVLVSLALQFQFTERFGLLVEPTYRHYFNSVYDINGDAIKNPYGIGVRGGIFFNF
ncbi:MAG: PorT family protein [Bacteroidales bacterium]|nr:PorT family protein [Bacteroidales bacterium]